MVLLFNLIPALIALVFILCAYLSWRRARDPHRALGWLFVMVVALLLYQKFQPSYGPKGVVQRSDVPAFEYKEIPVADHLRKPLPGEERDAKRALQTKEKLPFLTEDSAK
jgi:hypothetical protein